MTCSSRVRKGKMVIYMEIQVEISRNCPLNCIHCSSKELRARSEKRKFYNKDLVQLINYIEEDEYIYGNDYIQNYVRKSVRFLTQVLGCSLVVSSKKMGVYLQLIINLQKSFDLSESENAIYQFMGSMLLLITVLATSPPMISPANQLKCSMPLESAQMHMLS